MHNVRVNNGFCCQCLFIQTLSSLKCNTSSWKITTTTLKIRMRTNLFTLKSLLNMYVFIGCMLYGTIFHCWLFAMILCPDNINRKIHRKRIINKNGRIWDEQFHWCTWVSVNGLSSSSFCILFTMQVQERWGARGNLWYVSLVHRLSHI